MRNKFSRENKQYHIGLNFMLITAVLTGLIALGYILGDMAQNVRADVVFQDMSDTYTRDEPDDDPDSTNGNDDSAGSANGKKTVIDFDALQAQNPEIIGWIKFDNVSATKIDYPVAHHNDNSYYLSHNAYKQRDSLGCIFLDCNDAADWSDCYNIIYGHNMRSGRMFGSLRKFKNQSSFYANNKYFTLYTKDATYRYEIFSYEDVPVKSLTYTFGYKMNTDAYQKLINTLVSGSKRNTGIIPEADDRIVTLSTCTSAGYSYRFAVHAVCIGISTP